MIFDTNLGVTKFDIKNPHATSGLVYPVFNYEVPREQVKTMVMH